MVVEDLQFPSLLLPLFRVLLQLQLQVFAIELDVFHSLPDLSHLIKADCYSLVLLPEVSELSLHFTYDLPHMFLLFFKAAVLSDELIVPLLLNCNLAHSVIVH